MTRTTALARRIVRLALASLLGVAALFVLAPFAPVARADSRTDFLIGRLQAEDFRVRTNAALALGQTGDDAVVVPLCNAFGDSNAVVRQAVAVAFQRLAKPASVGCLKERLASETSDAVKREIGKALAAVQSANGGGGGESAPSAPHVVANAKYYVAISPIANQTGRPDGDIARVVGASLRGKLDELGGFQVAPDQESPDQARAAIARRKLKGYYLAVRVEKFDYSDGNLRVRVKIAVFTYPGKDLRGEVPAGLTQTGVRPGDTSAEDNLLQMAAARAVDLFAQNFP